VCSVCVCVFSTPLAIAQDQHSRHSFSFHQPGDKSWTSCVASLSCVSCVFFRSAMCPGVFQCCLSMTETFAQWNVFLFCFVFIF
jgi:hypothetical protein